MADDAPSTVLLGKSSLDDLPGNSDSAVGALDGAGATPVVHFASGALPGAASDHGAAPAAEDEEHGIRRRASSAFGMKTITYAGSMALNLNNIMGAAVVLLPLVNQQAGWALPLASICLVFVFSSFAATMMCEAMQRVPGNRNFNKRLEFCTLVEHYWGRRWYFATQVAFNLSLQASNIAAMVVATQILDNFIMQCDPSGRSYGFYYTEGAFKASGDNPEDPWGTPYVISLGFLVNMVICIPFGWLNLDENMWFQWFSLVGLVAFTAEFAVQFVLNAFPLSMPDGGADPWHHKQLGPQLTPAATDVKGQVHVLGLSVFAYAWVVTVPSWLNEKKPGVSVNKAVWWPSFWGLIMKVGCGILGAWAFVLLRPGSDGAAKVGADNILNMLSKSSQPSVTVYSAYLWNLTTMIPGIPVLAIMVRYNLLNGGVCGEKWSFFWGVVFPWLVTAFLVNSSLLMHFCNWVAILVQGYVNLVLPAAVYITALRRYPSPHDVRGPRSRRTAKQSGTARASLRPSESGSALTMSSPVASRSRPLLGADTSWGGDASDSGNDWGDDGGDELPVNAVPRWIPVHPRTVATFIVVFFSVLCAGVIVVNIYQAIVNAGLV